MIQLPYRTNALKLVEKDYLSINLTVFYFRELALTTSLPQFREPKGDT
jgi:hypothetical protein